MPQHDLMVGVRFEGRPYGFTQLEHFMRGFLTWHSPHAAIDVHPGPRGERVVTGYSLDPARSSAVRLQAMYRSAVKPLPGPRRELLDRADEIQRIEQKATLDTLIPVKRTWLRRLYEMLELQQAALPEHRTQFRVQVDASFTRETLERYLANWDRAAKDRESTDDVGLCFRGDLTNPVWLNRTLPRDSISVNIQRHGGELVDASALVRSLHAQRDHLLHVAQFGPRE
jgi:hypothetical protein